MYRNIFIAIILAVVIGLVFEDITWIQYPLAELSTMFTSLLKMCVVPLAFTSIAAAILDKGGTANMSTKIGTMIVGLSIIGAIVGMFVVWFIGVPSFTLVATTAVEVKAPTILAFINSCIPTNVLQSLVTGNMLQIIVLSVIVGVIGRASPFAEHILHGMQVIQYIFLNAAKYVMWFAPVGVFSLLYPMVAKLGAGVLISYVYMFGTLIVGMVLFTLVISLPFMYYYKVDGVQFLKTFILPDIANAIAGGSTNTMGVRMDYMREHTNIPHQVIDYVTPFVSVLMRLGSCICVSIYTLYAASIFGVTLSPWAILVVILLTPVVLTCAPGIIGGTLMDCAIVFAAVGIPLEAVTFLFATDYVMDVLRTVLNVQGGEMVTACIGAKNETIHNTGA